MLRSSRLAAGAAAVNGLAVGDELALRVYDDVTLELKLVAREESPLTGPVFQATVADGKWRNAVVMETGDGLLVNATDASGLVYSIVSTPDCVSIRELDPKAKPVIDLPSPEPAASQNSVKMTASVPMSVSPDQASTLVDMLVAYDTPAASWANANAGGITNLAQQCVSRMNTALANNGLDASFRFRLVGVIAVNANGGGDLNSTLNNVTSGSGAWSAVTAMRETVGADVVSTMIDTGEAYGTTGLGWSLTSTTAVGMSSFANNAFNVISVRAAAQSHVMTHETGHNMGAGHSDMQTSSPGPQSYNYSRGYYFTGTDSVAYYTIMAYNNDGYGNTYEQAPLFSDPDNSWAGVAAGNSTHDNARVLANTYLAVSQFRAQQIAMSYDVFFSPEPGSMFSDSVQVSLTPGKAGLEIRYTTDGSTPTASYGTVYSGPLTLTNTTTIRAVTITDGVAGPVYEATYYLSDLGTALNAPQLTWQTSPDYPWTTQTTDTYDGFAVKSADPFPVEGHYYYGESTWLETTVTGPTRMSFRYSQRCNTPGFEVLVDGDIAYSGSYDNWGEWELVELDIPTGSHTVRFAWTLYGTFWTGFNGVALDDVSLDNAGLDTRSYPPVMSPTTTTDEATAAVFTDSQTVSLTPAVEGGSIFYTLDGSDPTAENGIAYTGPIVLTETTLVRAVEVDPGKEASAEVSGLYLKWHPPLPGEWTTDVEGVKTAAAKDGRLICVVLASYETCSWSQAFYPIARSSAFCNWARDNGVYLLMADDTVYPDASDAQSYFWTLAFSYDNPSSIGYPTMYFALPSSPDDGVAKGIARNYNSQYSIGSVIYTGTVESLVAGFASVLTANGHTPTAFTVPDAAEVLGTEGVDWTNNSTIKWHEEYPNRMRAGGLMSSTYSSVLTATVHGKGRFIFSYRDVSCSWQNTSVFAKDGVQQFSHYYAGATDHEGTVTNEVTSSSGAVFTWTYTVNDSSRDYGAGYSTPCGFTIYDVRWIPEPPPGVSRDDGSGNLIEIPESWFVATGLVSSGATAEQLSTAADADTDDDGLVNWQEYVCGTDPNDPTDKFRCTISIVDGLPVVDFLPKSGYLDGYQPVVKGRTDLLNGSWSPANSSHHFFKAFVEKKP